MVIKWLSNLEVFAVLFGESIVTVKGEFGSLGSDIGTGVSPSGIRGVRTARQGRVRAGFGPGDGNPRILMNDE